MGKKLSFPKTNFTAKSLPHFQDSAENRLEVARFVLGNEPATISMSVQCYFFIASFSRIFLYPPSLFRLEMAPAFRGRLFQPQVCGVPSTQPNRFH